MAKSKERKKKSEEQYTLKRKKPETIDIRIKTIVMDPDEKMTALPILGYFPSCYNPLENSDSELNSSVRVYKNVSSRNSKKPRIQLAVEASGTNVNFVGTNYSGEATTPQLCNYALGVLDKETGVLRMNPIAANRVFKLEPKLGGSEVPMGGDKAEATTQEEKANKLRTLTAMYSTKKDIRRDQKRETLCLTGGPGTKKDIDLWLKVLEINKEALGAVIADNDHNAHPPYNLDAVSPDMAYPLDKIILRGEWDYHIDIYERAQSGLQLDPAVYPSFVCNRVGKLVNVEDESQKRRTARILSYITHLIKYKDKHSMNGVSAAKDHKFPSILEKKLLTMFITKLQLLISYFLVLTFFADDF